jgi:GTPase SAR1 family protein
MVLCGNASVGKTSITMRYKSGTFQDVHEPTLAGAYQ